MKKKWRRTSGLKLGYFESWLVLGNGTCTQTVCAEQGSQVDTGDWSGLQNFFLLSLSSIFNFLDTQVFLKKNLVYVYFCCVLGNSMLIYPSINMKSQLESKAPCKLVQAAGQLVLTHRPCNAVIKLVSKSYFQSTVYKYLSFKNHYFQCSLFYFCIFMTTTHADT